MSFAAIRAMFESAFYDAFVASALPGGDYANGAGVCANLPVSDYHNSDVDNGIASICTAAPTYDDPAFDPGTADYDNADLFPRSEIKAGSSVIVPVIYDNVQETPPPTDSYVILSLSYPTMTEPVLCPNESGIEWIRGSVQVSCYNRRAQGMRQLEEMAALAMTTLNTLQTRADPEGVNPRIGSIQGPTPVLSGDDPYALVTLAAPFTAKG